MLAGDHYSEAEYHSGGRGFSGGLLGKNYYAKSSAASRFFPDGRLKVPLESNLQIPSGSRASTLESSGINQ
jgi:hypothetical protein